MTRWWRRSSTGSSVRPGARALAVLALLVPLGFPAIARAQALRLETLNPPRESRVGAWVSYRVQTRFRAQAPREYTQRVAVVARDKYKSKDAFWVELKTEGLPSGKRIERGLFVIEGSAGDGEGANAEGAPIDSLPFPGEPPSVHMVRYQVLTSGGKLYEYPVSASPEPRAGSDVSTVELFEYDPKAPAVRDTLGPDTLRIGRRIVPTIVDRVRRIGADTWPIPGDKEHLNRPLLTLQFWRNPAVPITGLARSRFEVTMQRVPAPNADSLGAADSGGGAEPLRAAGSDSADAPAKVVTQTELTLTDLGADAVPEVTQEPQPAEEPPAPKDLLPGPGETPASTE